MSFTTETGSVSAAWHGDPDAGVVIALTHGAAGNLDTPQLKAVCSGLADSGLSAVRFNLPYAEAGRRSPSKPAPDEVCWRAVVDQIGAQRLYIGGRSYGGRMASHVAADGAKVAGLIFLAYPLHPPGKPEKLRTEHLPRIEAPMLFLQGSRDPFATPALLEATVAQLPNASLHWIEGGDHSHKVPKRSAADVSAELVSAITNWIAQR
jgi:uncharacterized protein